MGVGWECKNASATAYAAGGPGPVFHQKILLFSMSRAAYTYL